MSSIYKCPVCGQELKKDEKVYVCDLKHSYDIAKQGYVNLLLANQKNSKSPGDSKEMVENRRYFLEQGYYDRLSDQLNEFILKSIQDSTHPTSILDLGCGEGFYAHKLLNFLNKSQPHYEARIWGIDISKPAIQMAPKKDADIQFCIGSNFALPYMNESFDVVFSIFAPFDPEELMRVLKPGGKIIIVRPGPEHLKELASLIYEKFELQGDSSNVAKNLKIEPIQTFEVKYGIHLKNSLDIERLIGMTPYFWTLKEEKKLALAKLPELSCTADFQMLVFRR